MRKSDQDFHLIDIPHHKRKLCVAIFAEAIFSIDFSNFSTAGVYIRNIRLILLHPLRIVTFFGLLCMSNIYKQLCE